MHASGRKIRLAGRLALLCAALSLSACAWQHAPAPIAPASNPQVLMLGEVHDNVQGQRLRFADLKRRVDGGWRPAIAMEQFDHEDQARLSMAQKDCADTACIVRVMAGPRWDWDQYRAVIDLALDYQLPLVAVNLSRADASRVVRDGFVTTFDAATLAAYHLDAGAPADILAGQRQAIVTGHCNMLPEMMIGGMVNAQVARDVLMAKLVGEHVARGVVLLAGNGHVRKDIGVARWLTMADPALTVRSEGYLEQAGAQDRALYDAVHLVKAQQREDPCAKFKGKA